MNVVKVNLGGLHYEQDIDREWQEFQQKGFEDQLDAAISSFFWMRHIFGIELPQEAKNRFWEDFQRPDAERAREAAVYGLRYVNNLALFELLKSGMDFIENRDNGIYANDPEGARMDIQIIGLRFAELASKRDYKDFRRMADMIQNGGIPDSNRGGEDTLHGQIVREFCQHVANFRTLPTKKQIRESLGIDGDDKSKHELLRKSLKELGLSGLPQAGASCHTPPEN
jgi:hypothetical protein